MSGSVRRIRLRWVLKSAITALVLGASAVTLLEIDQSLARDGRFHVPQQALTLTRWLALAFGVVAVAIWVDERVRSHAHVTVGVVIAIVAVAATPIALAIAQPDDTAMTVVSFDARTGRRHWQSDIDMLIEAEPLKLDGRDRVVLDGFAPSGRCDTRPEKFILSRHDGRTLSHTTTETTPSPDDSTSLQPVTVNGVRFEIVQPNQPNAYARLQARDTNGRVLWSVAADAGRMSSVLYADRTVVAIYVPDAGAAERTPATRLSEAGSDAVVGVFDTRTGRPRWTIRASANALGAPLFNRESVFAIERDRLVVHATTTGEVLNGYPMSPTETFPDTQLQHVGRHDAVALVEGGAGRLTLFNRDGTVRWKANLPRVMPSARLTALNDTIYLTGGASLGYKCGGE